jgi:hypothetical protein
MNGKKVIGIEKILSFVAESTLARPLFNKSLLLFVRNPDSGVVKREKKGRKKQKMWDGEGGREAKSRRKGRTR